MDWDILAQKALDTTKFLKAEYADIRIIEERFQKLMVKNGVLRKFSNTVSYGYGLRVLKNGAWGFASSSLMDPDSVHATAKLAVEIAEASAKVRTKPVQLTEAPVVNDSYHSPFDIDPFEVPADDKIAVLKRIDSKLTEKKDQVQLTQVSMEFHRKHQLFVNTEGSHIDQVILDSGHGMVASAIGNNDFQTRSYPCSFGEHYECRGYELIDQLNLIEHAPRIASEAHQLLTAKQCPSGRKDIVLDATQMVLQVHESCGHPAEFDRILGYEANYAGESFMRIEDFGKLKYGSEHVTIYADATIPHALATFGYDDEGVPAQRFDIVKNGILIEPLTSRETAGLLGKTSNGTMRADGWSRIPIIRMTNINLAPGEHSFQELIEGIDDGIYMEVNKTWSIDHYRANFQFGCEIGWELKNGKIGNMIKNPQYTGITIQFWNSCDGVANKDHWKVWGLPNCGKGQPSQTMRVAHGTSPARFRNIQVGVGYD